MKVDVGLYRIAAVAVISCGCASTSAAGHSAGTEPAMAQCDRLSPVAAALTHSDPGAARYQAALSGTLLARVPQPNSQNALSAAELFMVMVKEDPRRPQEAVYILRTPRTSARQYRVFHARAKEQIQFQDGGVAADVTEAPLDAEIAAALERSWGSMVLGARWPDRQSSIAGIKWAGTFYTFDYRGDNVYGQGDTVSPGAGTCSAALVNIGELLSRFADESDASKRDSIRAELLRQSRMLVERLETTRP